MPDTCCTSFLAASASDRASNTPKICRGKEEKGKGRLRRSVHRRTRPIIGGNAVFGPPLAPAPLSLFSSFFPPNFSSLRLHETCNQSLLPNIRNDRVRASTELTIWEWSFGAAHKFRGLAITLHVPSSAVKRAD